MHLPLRHLAVFPNFLAIPNSPTLLMVLKTYLFDLASGFIQPKIWVIESSNTLVSYPPVFIILVSLDLSTNQGGKD